MQAEWEELARRNWLEDSEDPRPVPSSVSPVEKVNVFIFIRLFPETRGRY